MLVRFTSSISSTKFVVFSCLALAARAAQGTAACDAAAPTHTSVGADTAANSATDSATTDTSAQAAARAVLGNIKHIIETVAARRRLYAIATRATCGFTTIVACTCYARPIKSGQSVMATVQLIDARFATARSNAVVHFL